MKTLALQSDGDIRINEQNTFDVVRGNVAIRQRLKVTIATIRGEDPFDERHGMDVLAATGSGTTRLKMEIVRALEEDKDVSSVTNMNVEETGNRQYHVRVEVKLTDGSVETVSTGIR